VLVVVRNGFFAEISVLRSFSACVLSVKETHDKNVVIVASGYHPFEV
jgi:hypothetical protein